MYKEPPTGNITLEQFEEFAIDRLKVLREIETLGIRHKRGSEGYQGRMKESLKKFLPRNSKSSLKGHEEEILNERKKDHISHFILRLAYCRSEDLRRWFLSQEVELFRFRFTSLAETNSQQVDEFLKDNGLEYKPISEEERKEKMEELWCSGFELIAEIKVRHTDYFKVPFADALDLVRGRKVYLENGFAYVPRDELVSLVSNEFRMQLSRALAMTARALPYLEEDDRLLPKLTNLSRQYVGQDYTQKRSTGAKVTLDQIDSLSKSSYPLCMRQLHTALKEHHHLKHFGRLQYGLFIKGIGLSLEEALIFWRSEFTKVMDVDKFDKQYSYNIRHSYGKEGKRQDYTPYSCMKIIMTNPPGPGDHHGCPFRHTDADLLRQRLAAYRVPKEGVDELTASSAINHPNQYFDESLQSQKDGQGSTSRPASVAPSGLDHGKVTIKNETKGMSNTNENNDFGDIQMDDDDDMLGEIEGMDTMS
ncbi:PREDICTED: DNA primase large subunit-like isoform X2 [Acropora digitifera]|uniref:DNA primase large subunit-like isoform X2 n=1 Tax=Acropora digitifera TaxID=70779 RepID=UPI00077AB8C5|nr:PREDICTED: DNA primase large subunit-like isoform X2 [Acropora digitifera]